MATLNLPTSIPETNTKEINFSLHPNPSSGLITISNPSNQDMRIDIFTINGQLVQSHMSQEIEYMTNLPSGVYWVKLSNKHHQKIEKLIIINE